MVQSVSNLQRVTNLTGIAGTESPINSQDPMAEVQSLRLAVAELGRRAEVELDRIYQSLREVNIEADSAASTAQQNAINQNYWEVSGGRLIPKDPSEWVT